MSSATPILKFVRPLFERRPFADRTLCHFLRQRMALPGLLLSDLFPDIDQQPVTLQKMPRGSWSTPAQDVVLLLKLVRCAKPKRLMEIGSFRGYTALYFAQHVEPDASIVTVDRYPEHGEAYRQTPEASRIERRVGEMSSALFANDPPASFDLIFIDADHAYEGVRRDTELCLPLVSPNGYIVWHDYANWGYFSGYNGVPEYLCELSKQLPLAHVQGSDLAIYSPAWSVAGSSAQSGYRRAIGKAPLSEVGLDPWSSVALR